MLREPLVHFLALGLALFLLYALVTPPKRGENQIVISAATLATIRDQYRQLWGRSPTAAELKTLVETRVTDEILYREGRAMGLDQDDGVIKRRVRQKYELIAEETAAATAPSDAELAAWLKANPDSFVGPPTVSFHQVAVPMTGSTAGDDARLAAIRKALAVGADPASLGAASLLPGAMNAASLDTVARDFGSAFAGALAAAPVGSWSGPHTSAYGAHLVRVDARTPAAVPPLDAIRREVTREWENDRRSRARENRLAELRQRYVVVIEALPATAAR